MLKQSTNGKAHHDSHQRTWHITDHQGLARGSLARLGGPRAVCEMVDPWPDDLQSRDHGHSAGVVTLMREEGGEFQPHMEACFLEVVPQERIVFTTVLTEGWQTFEPWLALT